MENEETYKEDKRYSQCNKEAVITTVFFIMNVILIGVIPMVIGYNKPADQITLIAGFPSWFFYSCIIGWIVLSLLVILMVKLFFKNIDLD